MHMEGEREREMLTMNLLTGKWILEVTNRHDEGQLNTHSYSHTCTLREN